jgi:hypothetical protein
MIDTMFRRNQNHISGRAGTGTHGSTQPGDERGCGGVYHTETRLGATYFRESVPIDAVWATSNVAVVNACVMPVGYGVGDHCLFVVDFATALLVGTGCSQQIVRPALHCLNTRIAGCALRYNKALQRNILRHRLLERMVKVASSEKPKAKIVTSLNKLDKEGEAYMKHAEKKCRRLKSGRIPFSPRRCCGSGKVGCIDRYCDGMPGRYAIAELAANVTAMSNQRPISVDCHRYQTQALHLQRKM